MAKISRKPRKSQQEEQLGDLFSSLERQEEEQNDQDEGSEEKKNPLTDTLEALRAQLATLNERVERAERTNFALLSSPPQFSEQKAPQNTPKIDFNDLPDPAIDADAYNKALQDRFNTALQSVISTQEAERAALRTQERAYDTLWDDFATQYADYAPFEDRVEFATQKVVQRAKAKGIDAQRYIFGAREQFFADVVKEMDKTFGKPKSAANDDVDDAEDEAPDRTVGIFGGLESGGRPTQRPKEQAGDMIKEMQDLQKASGFY